MKIIFDLLRKKQNHTKKLQKEGFYEKMKLF